MIMKAASCIVDSLVRNKKIEIEQAPVYQYGYEIFISSCIICAIAIGIGVVMVRQMALGSSGMVRNIIMQKQQMHILPPICCYGSAQPLI